MIRDLAPLVAGIAMIMFAVCVVIFVSGRADVGAGDPFDKADAVEYLEEIEDGKDATRIAFGAGIAIDAFIVLIVAATTYTIFRDRSHWLAAIALAGFIANAAFSGVADCLGIVLTFVADDYVNGGAGDIAARDPSVLETGRVLGMMLMMLTQVQVTAFGLAELALGALLVFAPAGSFNPPRLIGWLAIVSAVCGFIGWGVFVAEAFLIFLIISTVGTLILLVWLGVWLILNRGTAGGADLTAAAVR
jgi:hypothetical protein